MPRKSQDNSDVPKYEGLWGRIIIALGTDKTGEIAAKMGLSASSVSEWKSGPNPSLDSLIKIATLGKVTVDWLLTGLDRQSKTEDAGEGDGGLVGSFLHTCVPAETADKIRMTAKARNKPLKETLLEILEIGVAAEPLAEGLHDFSKTYLAKLKRGLPKKTATRPKPKGKGPKTRSTRSTE